MAQVLITESYISDIASAIREKNGQSASYTPSQMANAIASIISAGALSIISKAISENGTYSAAGDSADAFSSVVVDVPNTYTAGDEGKVVSSGALSAQGLLSVSSNSVYDTTLISQVIVAIPDPVLVSKTITENGTYDPASDSADAYSLITVSVSGSGSAPVFVSKTISENGTYNPADDSADAYSQVVVNVAGGESLPSDYQEVEYIELYGSEYFSIDLRVLDLDILNFQVYVDNASPDTECGIIGSGLPTNSKWEIYYEDQKIYGYSRVSCPTYSSVKGKWISVSAYFSPSFSRSSIFTYGTYVGDTRYSFIGRLKSLQFLTSRYDKTVPVCSFLPCYRLSDNEIGLYNTAISSFYSNAGSGAFGKGPDV